MRGSKQRGEEDVLPDAQKYCTKRGSKNAKDIGSR